MRTVAALSVVVFPTLAFLVTWGWPQVPFVRQGALIAAAVAMMLLVARDAGTRAGPKWIAVALGVVASGMATQSAVDLHRADIGAWPTVDLSTEPWPEHAPAFVEVRGYLRPQWTLSEYAVAEGERPDETKSAEAVLVPVTGSTDAVIAQRGAIVVARVAPGAFSGETLVTLRGSTSTLPHELLIPLVDVDGGADEDGALEGVLLDTLEQPVSGDDVWVQLGIAALLAALAGGVLVALRAHPRAS